MVHPPHTPGMGTRESPDESGAHARVVVGLTLARDQRANGGESSSALSASGRESGKRYVHEREQAQPAQASSLQRCTLLVVVSAERRFVRHVIMFEPGTL